MNTPPIAGTDESVGRAAAELSLSGGAVARGELSHIDWTNLDPSEASRAWREDIQQSVDGIRTYLAELGRGSHGEERNDTLKGQLARVKPAWKKYPEREKMVRRASEHPQSLLEDLLRDGGKGGLSTGFDNRGDQIDAARWVGTIVAFGYVHQGLKNEPNPIGHAILEDLLTPLVCKSAKIGWAGRKLPDWAWVLENAVKPDKNGTNTGVYRPWNDVQEILLAALSSFEEHTRGAVAGPWKNDEVVHGSMALRLLAGEGPGRIADDLYFHLNWLEANTGAHIWQGKARERWGQLIQVAWERSLLERVTSEPATPKAPEDPEGPVQTGLASPSARRRAL